MQNLYRAQHRRDGALAVDILQCPGVKSATCWRHRSVRRFLQPGVGRLCRERVSGLRRYVRDVFCTSLAMLLVNALVAGPSGEISFGLPVARVAAANIPSRATDIPAPASPERDWKTIVLHHSATRGGDVATIDAEHRTHRDRRGNPWLGIGYHFVVGNGQKMGDGEVQATFRWHQQLPGARRRPRPQQPRHWYLSDRQFRPVAADRSASGGSARPGKSLGRALFDVSRRPGASLRRAGHALPRKIVSLGAAARRVGRPAASSEKLKAA